MNTDMVLVSMLQPGDRFLSGGQRYVFVGRKLGGFLSAIWLTADRWVSYFGAHEVVERVEAVS